MPPGPRRAVQNRLDSRHIYIATQVDDPEHLGRVYGGWDTALIDPAVYLICEPATRYYRVMTRSDWMPVLVGEVV